MEFTTADLCDQYSDELEVCEPRPGDWVYADEDGIIVARRSLTTN